MTALDEIEIAIEAVQSVSGCLPVFASMSFDKAGGKDTFGRREHHRRLLRSWPGAY
jgi:hypothetical protein